MVGAENVVFDANHPPAGRRLKFEVTVADVRPAHRHEVNQGHPGPEVCRTFG